jgi:hypothetical protein
MALAIQYDLLEQPEVSEVKADVAAQKESLRKIQKCLFAKMRDMSKMLFELYAQNEQLNQQYADALSMISSLVERLGKLEGKND